MHLFGYIRTFRNWHLYYRARRGRRHRDRSLVAERPPVVLELRHRNGLRIAVRAGTSDFNVARSVFVKNAYFPPGVTIADSAIVVDVGANIGCFTLQAAHQARSGRVLAYEPEPGNFRILQDNLARNGLAHAASFQTAVTDRVGEVDLHYSNAPGNTTTHSVYWTEGRDRKLAVPATTLGKLMEENALERIDYLKLDCEGAEPVILNSATDEVLRRIRLIAVEMNEPADAIAPALDRLRGLGFRELSASTPSMRFLERGP